MLKIAYNAKGRQGWNKIPKKTECLIRSDRRKYSRINVWENISKPLNAGRPFGIITKKTNFPLTWTSKAPCLSTYIYAPAQVSRTPPWGAAAIHIRCTLHCSRPPTYQDTRPETLWKTLNVIFHEFLHKKKRCSLPWISLEQRTSCSHRHPYMPLPPGAKYQMTKFDFSASCQLHFQGILHCRHARTSEPSWISWSTTLWPAGYTLLFNQRCEGALWQFETVLDAFFTICSHSPK